MKIFFDPPAGGGRHPPHREPSLPWLDGSDPLGGLIVVMFSAAAASGLAGFLVCRLVEAL